MIFKNRFLQKKILTASAVLLSLTLAGTPLTAAAKVEDDAIYTEEGFEDYAAELERNKKQAIQTNTDSEWPQGPAIGAAGAVVMDAESGAVLYGKNMNKHLYPASITKLMTALLAYENLDPADTVTFSENAVFGIERGSSNIGMDINESIRVDEALSGLMVASANEVAVALGERVSGTESDFVDLMNERAAELGCRNTHFVTTNGLHDSNHYTCAYDMALIAREIYQHPDLVEYTSLMNYHFEASENQPDDFWILNTNDFLTQEIPCDDIVGGKTGYTDQARQTLVSFAERDGKKLVCVIMREEAPYQYYDTIDLLNYAFDNFKKINVTEAETRFTQKSPDFLSSGPDIFGDSTPFFYIREDTSLMVPNSVSFSDLTAEITALPYAKAEPDQSDQSGQTESTDQSDTPEDSDKSEGSEDSGQPDTEETDNTAASEEAAAAGTTAAQTAAKTAAQEEPSSSGDVTASAFNPASVSSSPMEDGSRVLGLVQYKFHDYNLGTANVIFRPAALAADAETKKDLSGSDAADKTAEDISSVDSNVPTSVHGIRSLVFGLVHTGAHGSVYLNILLLMPLLLAFTFILCIILFVIDYFAQKSRRRRKQQRRAQRAHRQNASRPDTYDSYDFEKTPRLSGEENSVRRNTPEADSVRYRTYDRRTGTGRRTDPGQRTDRSDRGRISNTGRRTNQGRGTDSVRRTGSVRRPSGRSSSNTTSTTSSRGNSSRNSK